MLNLNPRGIIGKMLKNQQQRGKNSLYKPLWAIFLVLAILLVGGVSYFKLDGTPDPIINEVGGNGNPDCKECWRNLNKLAKDNDAIIIK